MKVLSIFSGIGGFDLAAEWVGFEVVGQVENNPFCIRVLEKHWPSVKRIEDVKIVKGDEFGAVDLLCGGPPCQPASCAGKRRGTKDDRWLWDETLRLVKAIKPKWCLFENPTGIISLQGGIPFEHLLLDLEAQGYSVEAFVLPAASVNAPHRRDRVWIVAYDEKQVDGEGITRTSKRQIQKFGECDFSTDVAYPKSGREISAQQPRQWDDFKQSGQDVGNSESGRLKKQCRSLGEKTSRTILECSSWWSTEPSMGELVNGVSGGLVRFRGRVAKGIPNRVNKLKSLGNAIVPQVAFQIFRAIKETEEHKED